VLGRRLTELSVPPGGKRHGKVYVGTVGGARGLSFDAVFVPAWPRSCSPEGDGRSAAAGFKSGTAFPDLET